MLLDLSKPALHKEANRQECGQCPSCREHSRHRKAIPEGYGARMAQTCPWLKPFLSEGSWMPHGAFQRGRIP